MMRVWNYNKSRYSTSRGARYIEVFLDSRPIFKGEIKQATGSMNILESDACSECILFTTNERVLDMIMANDSIAAQYNRAVEEGEEVERARIESKDKDKHHHELLDSVPDNQYQDNDNANNASNASNASNTGGDLERPTTGGERRGQGQTHPTEHVTASSARVEYTAPSLLRANSSSALRPSTAARARTIPAVAGRVIELMLVSSWGDRDRDMIGLTGLALMDSDLQERVLPVPDVYVGKIDESGVGIEPQNDLQPSQRSDIRTLLNGENFTTKPKDMWFVTCPRERKDCHIVLRFELDKPIQMKGLRIWNCNAGRDGAHCGVKLLHIYLDGELKMKNSIARKAPGVKVQFDFAQFLPISDGSSPKKKSTHSPSSKGKKAPTSKETTSKSMSKSKSVGAGVSINITTGFTKDKDAVDDDFIYDDNDSDNDENENGERSFDDDEDDYLSKSAATFGNSSPIMSVHAGHGHSGHSDHSELGRYNSFNNSFNNVCQVPQQYETPVFPRGCIIKIVIQSTHGDLDYCGLNSLALFDTKGRNIEVSADQIQGTPWRDINDLKEIQNRGHDARCLENLVNGSPKNTYNDRYLWLCPLTDDPSTAARNTVLIFFDEPVSIGHIKMWNYSKTPSRGVKELEIYIDDVLCYRGSLNASPSFDSLADSAQEKEKENERTLYEDYDEEMNWGSKEQCDLSQAILFTNDPVVIKMEEGRIPRHINDIAFFDCGDVVKEVVKSSAGGGTARSARPMTAVQGRTRD